MRGSVDFWLDRPVLVTGAGGFIGSHLVDALRRRGARVRAFVRYNSRNDWGWLEDGDPDASLEIFRGDVVDPDTVRRATRGTSVVFHLAALMAIPYSYLNPREFVSVNVVGTANLLDAVRDFGVDRFVQTSTSEVYGTARRVPMDEEHPLQAQSPYAATKIAAEKLAESYARSFDLPVTIVRPFNTYGPRQSTRAVIPTIIAQALTSDRVRLGALRPVRDLTYVDDTVEGFLRAAESDGPPGEAYNFGSGEGISIGDLAGRILARIGRPVTIEHDAERDRPTASEVQRLIADAAKAAAALGWRPTVSLDEGLGRTIDWFRERIEDDAFKAGLYNV